MATYRTWDCREKLAVFFMLQAQLQRNGSTGVGNTILYSVCCGL